MSLDTLNNGDTGLQARTKINAAIAAIPLERGSGVLQGYNNPGSDALAAYVDFTTVGEVVGAGSIRLTVDGAPYEFTYGDSSDDPPPDFQISVNATGLSAATIATNLLTFLASYGITNPDGNTLRITSGTTGVASQVKIERVTGVGGISNDIPQEVFGIDAVPPSGAVTSVDIIAQDGSKTIKPVRVCWFSADHGIAYDIGIALQGGGETAVGVIPANSSAGEMTINADNVEGWLSGRASAKLAAYYNGGPDVDSSTLTIVAFAEQF